MPPKVRFTREEIIAAALDMTKESGISSVTARGLGARLGSSAKPIFGLFQNMEEVHREVMAAANELYNGYLKREMESGKYPPYKASGMGYIRFAREQKELFKLLFMRDRSEEVVSDSVEEIEPLLRVIMKNTGLSHEEAVTFHLEMWVYVHGIASMIATSYLDWDEEFTARVLTDGYEGLKGRYCGKEVSHEK